MTLHKNAQGNLSNELADKIDERERATDYLLKNLKTEDFYCLSILLGIETPWNAKERKDLLFKIQPK